MGGQRQSVTIRHVAADAGVSMQTVSRVINSEPNVRPHMAERVRASIAKLGYVPSIAAQRLSGSRSYLIVALNDRERTLADWRSRQGSDWVNQMLLGGMLTCAAHGYRLIVELVDTDHAQVERELSGAIAALRPDGVILTPPHSDNPLILAILAARHIPFARIGSCADGPGFTIDMDDRGAAALATRRLIDLGHRRVGFIAGPTDYAQSERRVAGWRDAMAAAGLADTGLLAPGDFGFASGTRAATQLLDLAPAPTAIIASNDQMALAALDQARTRGLAVPDDLSIVSFDDTPVVRYTHPPLAAISQPIADVAARAAEMIIARTMGRPVEEERVVIPSAFVPRASIAPPRPPHCVSL
ncbi:LacI family DNA-binding transcriptional regulator [uncultured Sphingomonas sp.]|uniref:LacI family DNA-binding transcriptional regulator n=1 Tax=uncultured Sphingomonas sp. TaxID=158754 RepID=UPI003749DD09